MKQKRDNVRKLDPLRVRRDQQKMLARILQVAQKDASGSIALIGVRERSTGNQAAVLGLWFEIPGTDDYAFEPMAMLLDKDHDPDVLFDNPYKEEIQEQVAPEIDPPKFPA